MKIQIDIQTARIARQSIQNEIVQLKKKRPELVWPERTVELQKHADLIQKEIDIVLYGENTNSLDNLEIGNGPEEGIKVK